MLSDVACSTSRRRWRVGTAWSSDTAEGVETAAQAQLLDALDCDHLQGFLFARPHPAPFAVTAVAASAEATWRQNLSDRHDS